MKPHQLFFLCLFFIIAPLQAKTIVIIGDSLSAGYGINVDKGWVSLLAKKLEQEAGLYQVVNLSTSGDTSSNGLAKLPIALKKYQPAVIIIELGANDGLRGLSLDQLKANLEKMLIMSQKSGAKVLLLATLLPPNYGPRYLERFNKIYAELAQSKQVVLVPMFLEGVAGHEQWMQKDGLHPNESAQQLILDNIWPYLKSILEKMP